MKNFLKTSFVLLFFITIKCFGTDFGVDRFFQEKIYQEYQGKGFGVITNQTGVSVSLEKTVDLFLKNRKELKLIAFFAPEHGLYGNRYAGESVHDEKIAGTIPVHSLHGKFRRPTSSMLEGVDVLVFDIQDIGSRSYTYLSTLCYCMEEAAKKKIEVIVLDRPNPINGLVVDGGGLEKEWRSFIGYVDVPYCHGMTIGEIATYFNTEYKIGCNLRVIEMKGWSRSMRFEETGHLWIPTSPHVPDAQTALYYPITGIMGELSIVSIGIGTTLPFRVVGAPWIDADLLAAKLKALKLPGVTFHPIHFKPFIGSFKESVCHGVEIFVTDPKIFKPISTGYLLMGLIKSLYPKQVMAAIGKATADQKNLFSKANGSEKILKYLSESAHPAKNMVEFARLGEEIFLKKRERYLRYGN